jgi:hypothetical protein
MRNPFNATKTVLMVTILCSFIAGLSSCYVKRPNENCYVRDIGTTGKKLLHVEGSPYDMGYAVGYYFPDEVIRNCSNEYYIAVCRDLMGDWVSVVGNIDIVVNAVKWSVLQLTRVHRKNIPPEYIEEMNGIVDGVRAVRPNAKFSFGDVLLLNMAVDTVISIIDRLKGIYGDRLSASHFCHGFVATGNATADGHTLMGRHFMFPHEVFSETAMLIEYVPDRGYPFVSITPPGYVGVTAAMNGRGMGIGMDMLHSRDSDYTKVGMGRLLLARKVIQYSESINGALTMIKASGFGVPNIYIIGDGNGDGAVVEMTANHIGVRRLDSRYDAAEYTVDVHQEQIEAREDLVLVANHAIVPEIANITYGSDNSLRRYPEMCGLLEESYGQIDQAKGRDIIDFLHPGGPYSWFYGDDPEQPVAASVTLFDLSTRELWSLFGRYSDPWVYHRLDEN